MFTRESSADDVLLDVRDVSKTFPGLRALSNVSLTVRAGEIVAVCGHNGSGKSTLVKILAGVYQPDPGVAIAETQADLHFIHQDLGLVETLSVVENLDLARDHGRRVWLPVARRSERRRAELLLAEFGVVLDVTRPVRELAQAERAIVAIARALDGWRHDRNVLVLDEPTAALHADERTRLFKAIDAVRARGTGIVFISHHLEEVFELADRTVVLRDGQVIADTPTVDLTLDRLVRMIAGKDMDREQRAGGRVGETALAVRGLAGRRLVRCDLTVRAGEIVGLAGVLGSGREEICRLLFGALPAQAESFFIGAQSRHPLTPPEAIGAGLAYVPADRWGEGAVMTMSLRENLTLPRIKADPRRAWNIDGRAERREAGQVIESFEVRPRESEQALALFSGGNQQKVVLAKWCRNQPRVLLMDEPTQGVDVGAKSAIYDVIRAVAAEGAGVVIASSDTGELASVCNRVLVVRDGLVAAEITGAEVDEERLVREEISSEGVT